MNHPSALNRALSRVYTPIALLFLLFAFTFAGTGDFELACMNEYKSNGYSSKDCVSVIEKRNQKIRATL